MGIALNHAIVHCTDKREAAGFFARLIGTHPAKPSDPFVAVTVNDWLTLDFYDDGPFVFGHFAFLADEANFDAVLGRVVSGELDHGSGPFARDRSINRLNGGAASTSGIGTGNSYELFTVDPIG